MPMRSWASAIAPAVLALAGCAAAHAPAPVQSAGTAVLKLDLAGRAASVKVAVDPAEIDAANDHVVTQLGTRGAFLLLADSYASRAQSMARCQAGHETWVRLIETRTNTERWSKRVESCLHDIQPGDPVAGWTAAGMGFSVNLLSQPSLHMAIQPDGRIVAQD